MQVPLQISFRDMDPSPSVEARIRTRAEKLERFHDRITSCRVMVERRHQHQRKGAIFHVRIEVTVPEGNLVVSRERAERQAHEDVYVAVRDAFDALRRQLEDRAQRLRADVKHHEPAPQGIVSEIRPATGFGVITTPDGREIHFHRNSVVDADFDHLSVGTEVRFAEADGTEVPTASTVHVVGRSRRPSG